MAIRIDKSLFSADELMQYNALIAKAVVEPDDEGMEEEYDIPAEKAYPEDEEEYDVPAEKACRTEKADPEEDEPSPELQEALKRLGKLEKSLKMDEMKKVAKRYAVLGEDPDTLAKSLYRMRESSEANYRAYIAVLDKSAGIVEKSGLFTEIGKSFSGNGGGSAVDKINAAAESIMKSDPHISRESAIAKAWGDNPELIAEYDAEYRR